MFELTPKQVSMIEELLKLSRDKDPVFKSPLFDLGEVAKWSGLSKPIMEEILKNTDGRYICEDVFKTNRVPNDLTTESLNKYFKEDHIFRHGKDPLKDVIAYNDLGLLQELSKNPNIFKELVELYPEWYKLLRKESSYEAIQTIQGKHSADILTHLILNVYLDRECVDYIINYPSTVVRGHLFRRQILTEEQVVLTEYSLRDAWHYYPLANPKKYQPQWTNKGDRNMVGPNMPDDWAREIMTSKKSPVLTAFAMHGPEKFLPLLIGIKTRTRFNDPSDIVQARLSGKPEVIWRKVYYSAF